MDLSKGFDCLNHVLMIEKLEAYGFAKEALTLMHNYLQEGRQRIIVNLSFSSWRTTIQGVPQGSVL